VRSRAREIAKPSGPAARPAAGPVVPLTVTRAVPEELLGGGGVAPATDAAVTRTITKGEPLAARSGRADDFSWPRGAINVEPGAVEPTAADTPVPNVGAKSAKPAQRVSAMDAYAAQTSRHKPAQRRPRSRPNPNPPVFSDSFDSRWLFGWVPRPHLGTEDGRVVARLQKRADSGGPRPPTRFGGRVWSGGRGAQRLSSVPRCRHALPLIQKMET
jgi:hypothetical protein